MAMLRSLGCMSFTRLPAISISPPVTDSSPAIMRSKVDLPQPEGPSSTTKVPSSMVEVDAMDDFDVAIVLANIFECYRCHVMPSSLRITREEIVEQARIVCQIEE